VPCDARAVRVLCEVVKKGLNGLVVGTVIVAL
jgi:hypothetical protein